jgi:hypothetical protein
MEIAVVAGLLQGGGAHDAHRDCRMKARSKFYPVTAIYDAVSCRR